MTDHDMLCGNRIGRLGVLRKAYLCIASRKGLLGQPSPFGDAEHLDLDKIVASVETEAPDWFDPGRGLPPYQLPEKMAAELAAWRKQQKKIASFRNAFLAALDQAVPEWLHEKLSQAGGNEGLEIMQPRMLGVESHSSNRGQCRLEIMQPRIEMNYHFLFADLLKKYNSLGLVGCMWRQECLRAATLALLYRRGLLEESHAGDKQAFLRLARYATGVYVPPWFAEGRPIPALAV